MAEQNEQPDEPQDAHRSESPLHPLAKLLERRIASAQASRTVNLVFRVTPAEKDAIKRTAYEAGIPVSDLIRFALSQVIPEEAVAASEEWLIARTPYLKQKLAAEIRAPSKRTTNEES